MTTFDFSEVDRLAADLGRVPRETAQNVNKALDVSARHIKDDWKTVSKGLSGEHAAGYPRTISYEAKNEGGDLVREIGPVPGGQGSLGFLEEGGDIRGASPQHAARLALRANTDDFLRGILKAATDPLES